MTVSPMASGATLGLDSDRPSGDERGEVREREELNVLFDVSQAGGVGRDRHHPAAVGAAGPALAVAVGESSVSLLTLPLHRW